MREFSRRQFLKHTALATGSLALGRMLRAQQAPAALETAAPNSKLAFACVGVGGRGGAHVPVAAGEKLVAICDVSQGTLDKVAAAHPGVKAFTDYRKMFDEMMKDIDAVFVATPDHHHACASMVAIKAGKHCYTEKPLTWSIQEARALALATAEKKVATQMGNQGHANKGNRLIVQWIRDGALGTVKEVHTWTNRPVWPQGIKQRPPTAPVPAGLDWDCWIGPAPFREYHDGLHGFKWRGWLDFGCGAIGDMGCHSWDNVFWAMQPDYPTSVELLEIQGPGGKETFPSKSKFRWNFPAKGHRPGFVAYWYSGGLKPPVPEEMRVEAPAQPPAEAKPKENGQGKNNKPADDKPKLPGSGTLYIGTKGKMLVTGDYGDSPRLIPEPAMQAYLAEHKDKISPNAVEPSPGHHQEFLMAARGEKPWNFPKSNFADYAGPLTEVMLLGAIVEKIGQVGFKLECNPVKREVKTKQALPYLHRQYRQGWPL